MLAFLKTKYCFLNTKNSVWFLILMDFIKFRLRLNIMKRSEINRKVTQRETSRQTWQFAYENKTDHATYYTPKTVNEHISMTNVDPTVTWMLNSGVQKGQFISL